MASAPVVLATDRFIDVSSENVHHDDVNRLAGAGITVGCGLDDVSANPLFCPDQPLTRAQMASFLVRGLGRTTAAQFVLVTDAVGEWAWDITITPGVPAGALSGATGYINLGAVVTVRSRNTADCTAVVQLRNATDGTAMGEEVEVGPFAPGESVSVPILGQTVVASPGTRTLEVRLRMDDTSLPTNCSISAGGYAIATYVPFGEPLQEPVGDASR